MALALAVVCMGFVFVSSLAPPTPSYRFPPGHDWIMAAVCWGFALFLACCSYLGFRAKAKGGGD